MKITITASTDAVIGKFKVGAKYSTSMLYGGSVYYTVVDRTADTVTLAESHISEDDGSRVDDGEQVYPIVLLDMYDSDYESVIGKQEAVELWEYQGEKGYLFSAE